MKGERNERRGFAKLASWSFAVNYSAKKEKADGRTGCGLQGVLGIQEQ